MIFFWFFVVVQVFVEATLDLQQEQSWHQLRCLYRGPSMVWTLCLSVAAEEPLHLHYLTQHTNSQTHQRNAISFICLVYIYIYMCVCVCVYIYIYIYIYICCCKKCKMKNSETLFRFIKPRSGVLKGK